MNAKGLPVDESTKLQIERLVKQAEQWDAEITAVAKGVAVETPKGK